MTLKLETQRLIVRDYANTESEINGRHKLSLEGFNSTDTLDDTRAWMAWTVANYQQLAKLYQPPYGDYAIALKSSSEVIGSVGIVQSVVPWGVFDTEPTTLVTPEFGLFWVIDRAHQGQGYATEAGSAVLAFLFDVWNVKQVIATTERENSASKAVMRKLGMEIMSNPTDTPFWFEIVGVIRNPKTHL